VLITFPIRKQGATKFALDLNAPNEPALEMYKKLGFKIEGTLRDQIWIDGAYQDIIIMGKFVGNEK